MNLSKPKKSIIISFEEALTEDKYLNLKSYLCDMKGDFLYEIFDDREDMLISADDIGVLRTVLEELRKTFNKNSISYTTIFKIRLNVEVDHALEFLSTYVNKQNIEMQAYCMEVKFICAHISSVYIVNMKLIEMDSITIEVSVDIEENVNMQNEYEKALAIVNKIIKY